MTLRSIPMVYVDRKMALITVGEIFLQKSILERERLPMKKKRKPLHAEKEEVAAKSLAASDRGGGV